MTLTQPEPTARKTTDTDALLYLATLAATKRHGELLAQERLDDERAVFHARAETKAAFGEDALAALGEWMPSPDMPEGTYQAFVELVQNTSLICTMPRDGSGAIFKVLAYCGKCSSHSTTAVGSLAELAGALHKAGVR
ncbi:hypothetical protein [Streptomyces sp. NPDC007094]|uniref:hypothetical protein n=1 Tax=Streptomyces sp. NPDC007094 TaxID=3155359 RepID=UPI0033C932B0